MNRKFLDISTVNIIALAALAFIEALQILIIVVLIFSFIPIPLPVFVQKLFPLNQYDVRLEREGFFYHLWIAMSLGAQGVLLFVNRRRLGEDLLWRSVLPYVCTMAGFVLIQIFAVFKIFLYGDPGWARMLLYIAIGVSLLARFFWIECWRSMVWLWYQSTVRTFPRRTWLFMDAGVIGLLIILIFAPHLCEVLARMFSYDKFYHLDSFIMAPAWAHHGGLILNKDVTSEYSLIIPIVFDGLMRLAGGFNYANAVGIMIGLCALYYFLLYGLFRYWLGSFCLAFFAILWCVQLQFFHWGVVPLIWIYPSATPLRFLPDVFFLFFILRFTQSMNLRWLVAAAIANGLGLAWIMDVGTYMYLTLGLAALAYTHHKGTKIIPQVLGLLVLPWCVALGVLSIFYGSLITQGHFWRGAFEFASLFLQGWGALPITEGLKDKQFFALCIGFFIPVVYVATLMYSAGMFIYRQSRQYLFMALMCVYGLGLYHYFIHRSGVTSYYAVIVPFIFVAVFWIRAFLTQCTEDWQKAIKLFLCVWALGALLTGYLFTYYPNVLNVSGLDWTPEKQFYIKDFDFSQDAALIDSLTGPQDPVALISSFETKILMQANRRPFFYYFPMMESEHMRGDKLRGIYLHTHARLERTVQQFDEAKPAYIFIQSRLFEGPEAQSYEDSHEGFKQLMAYIRLHYHYQAQGQYLTALEIR